MTEIFFKVRESPEGGYEANELGASIYTGGDHLDEIRSNILEAVECHFEVSEHPKWVRMMFVREEVVPLRHPRDLSGRELGKQLGRVDYLFSRQLGSHMRLTREEPPKHSITIPDHNEHWLGTLRQMHADVAGRLGTPDEELIELLLA